MTDIVHGTETLPNTFVSLLRVGSVQIFCLLVYIGLRLLSLSYAPIKYLQVC